LDGRFVVGERALELRDPRKRAMSGRTCLALVRGVEHDPEGRPHVRLGELEARRGRWRDGLRPQSGMNARAREQECTNSAHVGPSPDLTTLYSPSASTRIRRGNLASTV